MTFSIALYVILGGAIGAPLRYVLERSITRRLREPKIPWGLLVVNVVGSFIAGIAATALSGMALVFVLTGFCGALTTFSGFGWEISSQIAASLRSTWMTTVALMMVGTIVAFALGYFLVRA